MNNNRNQLLAKIHIGTKVLFGADKDQHRDFIKQITGKRSCADCEVKQLNQVIDQLNRVGAFDGNARGGKGIDCPTDAQLRKLAALSRLRGWDGLEDKRLLRFIRRTAKVDHPRFLTRHRMSAVITGLSNWNKQVA